MHHVRLLARQALNAVAIDPDAVRQRRTGPRDPNGIEIGELVLPGLALHHLQLGGCLGGVRVNHRPVPLGQVAHRPQQRPGTRRGEARREAIAQPATRGAVPFLTQIGRFLERGAGRLAQAGGCCGGVHQALAHSGAQADNLERFERRTRVPHRLHVEDGGRPAEQQLGSAEHSGPVDRVGSVGGFERPDALRQPVFEYQVVGETAKQRLAQMNVRLNQSGNDDESGAIDRLGARLGPPLPAHRRNAIARDYHIPVHDAAPRVHREDARVLENQRGRRTHVGENLSTVW